MKKPDIIRILDVNLNRMREGLRVCEDVLRFIYENEDLTKQLKDIRHELTEVLSSDFYNKKELTESRDVDNDKTKYLNPDSEFKRDNIEDVFKINMQRVQESLRVLEEITKLESLDLSKNFKLLRFKVYNTEKTFFDILNKESDKSSIRN